MSIRYVTLLLLAVAAAAQAATLDTARLQASLERLARSVKGSAGVCVQLVAKDSTPVCLNAEHRYPMQSVIKLVVGMAVLDAIDRKQGTWKLNESVTIYPRDLSLYVQPIAKLVTPSGYTTTIDD